MLFWGSFARWGGVCDFREFRAADPLSPTRLLMRFSFSLIRLLDEVFLAYGTRTRLLNEGVFSLGSLTRLPSGLFYLGRDSPPAR